jgi:hypothetical protein
MTGDALAVIGAFEARSPVLPNLEWFAMTGGALGRLDCRRAVVVATQAQRRALSMEKSGQATVLDTIGQSLDNFAVRERRGLILVHHGFNGHYFRDLIVRDHRKSGFPFLYGLLSHNVQGVLA